MIMGNCKDCKYWREGKTDTRESVRILGAGRCSRVGQFWDSTEWGRISSGRDFTPDTIVRKRKRTSDLAFVQDGSDYRADLITLPDFGCVMFEKNGETDERTNEV